MRNTPSGSMVLRPDGSETETPLKVYLVGSTDKIRIFGDKETPWKLKEAIPRTRVDKVLGCAELLVYDLDAVLRTFPNAVVTSNLQGLIESRPEILIPIELPDDDYWQSLLPPHFTLRPFQIEYLNWAEGRRQQAYPPKGSQKGVICSLDQGLGKTPVAITWDQHLREKGLVTSTFVVCRNNNKRSTWAQHFNDLTNLYHEVIEGNRSKRLDLFKQFHKGKIDVAIMNYETFRLHEDQMTDIGHFIVDEAHKIANHKSKQSQVANIAGKNAVWTSELTGGAAQNRIETQLWHPLHLTDRIKWPSHTKWKMDYCILKEIQVPLYRKGKKIYNRATGGPVLRTLTVVDGVKNRPKLSAEIAPHIYQKSKWDVGEQLPPKIYQAVETFLTKEQRKLYIQVRDDIITQINGVTIPIALTKSLRLYQICATLEYFDLGDVSRKADEASGYMYDVLPKGHKALVFTQHVLLANAIHRRLIELGANALLLTGQHPKKSKDKDEVREQFKTSDVPFLVTMIQLEGEGSSYEEADYVFRLDRDHRPKVNLQCEDRAHRLTSTRPVNIIDYITRGTIEQVQMDILKEKEENLDGVFDLAKIYTMGDIIRMLEATPKASD